MKNKLILGDCETVLQKATSDSVDLIITDVPYGIDYKSNRQGIDRKKSNKREGDRVVRDQYFTEINNDQSLPTKWLKDAYRVLKNNSAIYIFIHWSTWRPER